MTDEIRRHLTENLEQYENNAILNKLTPGRSTTHTGSSGNNTSGTTASTRRKSAGTPGRRAQHAKHSDSNIVTSPVKARRYASSEEGDFDTTRQSSTFNVPLRDSPKRRMRQGTPKLLSGKNSQREATVTTFKAGSLSLREMKTLLPPDDEFDDIADPRMNDTIMSDIPNELISPEKLVFNKDVLTRNSPDKRADIQDSLSQKSIYPILSPPSMNHGSSPRNPLFPQVHQAKTTSQDTSKQPISQSTITQSKPLTSLLSAQGRNTRSVAIHEDGIKDLKSPPRRLSKLSPSLFESSDDEPVPELTVVLPVLQTDFAEKRLLPTSNSPSKKRKTTSLYPTLDHTSEKSAKTSDIIAQSSPHKSIRSNRTATDSIPSRSIYPDLMGNSSTSQQQRANEKSVSVSLLGEFTVKKHTLVSIEDTTPTKKLQSSPSTDLSPNMNKREATLTDLPPRTDVPKTKSPTTSSATLYPNIPRDTPGEESTITQQRDMPHARKSPAERTKSLLLQRRQSVSHPTHTTEETAQFNEPNNKPVSQLIEQPWGATSERTSGQAAFGEPNNWNRQQWVKFIKCFKVFETNGCNDFSVFSPDVMKFLRCDQDELLLKIGFYKENRDSIRRGQL